MGPPHRATPVRRNPPRKQMTSSPPPPEQTNRKKPKTDVDSETDSSEVNSTILGISDFAPLSLLTTLQIDSVKKLRQLRRLNHLMGAGEFRLSRKNRGLLAGEASPKESVVDEKSESVLPGLICNDLSNGKEKMCIPVTNEIDDLPVAPEEFEYITSIRLAKNLAVPASSKGCNCKGNCTNTRTCSCAVLNGNDFPYVAKSGGGRLSEPKAVVFECGPNCRCAPGCLNRTSQQGLKYRLEVYRTVEKGWGVRSWDFIPSGGFLCEYMGVLRRTSDVENVSVNDYFFEIDCEHTMNGIGAREKRLGEVPLVNGHVGNGGGKSLEESDPDYCIDGGSSGNVSRFINHSCEPNLFVQCVLSSHRDVKQARIVLFASDDILPMQELTYDYGYEVGSVADADGRVKELPCCCGTEECRKRCFGVLSGSRLRRLRLKHMKQS